MEFVLNLRNRNITDNELLEDIKRLATLLNKNTVLIKEYNKLGKYSYDTIARRFGSWNNALELCGLESSVHRKESSKTGVHISKVSNQDLISDIQSVAHKLGKQTISCNEYDRYGQYCADTCIRRFSSWDNALIESGLSSYIQGSERRLDDDKILEEIERIWILLGRQPSTTDIRNGVSKYSLNTYIRHFGSWYKALEAFIVWVNDDKPTYISDDSIVKQGQDQGHFKNDERYLSDTTKHRTSREINLKLRFLVMKRDNFKCFYCGASPAKEPSVVHIDHIKPWSKGGETTIDNLRTSCSKCNLGKSDLDV